ncbi:hypothetical protein IM538_22030 [Cytobacillus suaedae]|nr:hypothetical protein IM538_22030 [Cytobacillus suaedae]
MQLILDKIRQPLSNLNFNPKFKVTLVEVGQLQNYFSVFRLQFYLLLLFSPIGIGAPAYLFSTSFGAASVGIGIGLFLVGILLLLPWTFVSLLFLFTTFQAKKWQRYGSWAYVGILAISLCWWIIIF